MPQRYRIPDQNKPVTITLRRMDQSVIQAYNNINADEIDFPTLNEGFIVDSVNSLGQTSRRIIDNVTRILQAKNHIGRSVADGDTVNHLDWIAKGSARNYTYTGTVYGDPETDAELNALGASEFDHTISHSSYEFPYDEVVRMCYLTNPSDLTQRMSLRVSLLLTRDDTKMNNGTSRTLFYGMGDANLRPNGQTNNLPSNFVVPQGIPPSYASPVCLAYAKRLTVNFFKRYWRAINDGTIMCVGWVTGTSGEAEYPQSTHGADWNPDGESYGDFNPAMVNGFKSKFPEYAFVDNNTIAGNDRTSSDLGVKWSWYLMDTMRRFEWSIIDEVKAQIPQLTRTKWTQIDVGSFADELAPRRRTFDGFTRAPQEIMVIKSNDECLRAEEKMRWLLEDLSSIARYKGAIAISEPSPAGSFDDNIVRAYVVTTMKIMKEFGIGMSFVNNSTSNHDYFRSASGFQQYSSPLYNAQFKNVGGNRKLVRSVTDLSSILTSGIGVKEQNYYDTKSSQGISRVDMITRDNLNFG